MNVTQAFFLFSMLAYLLGAAPAPAAAQDEVGTILTRINTLRTSVGLQPYSVNSALSAAAQAQAQWIVDSGSVSHTRPDGSGPRTRALAAGYPSTDVSENIYGGTMATAEVAMSFWLNSGVHYAGMTHPTYREIGVGVASGGWGRAYVTVFGNPGGPAPVVAAPVSASGGESAPSAFGAAPAAPAAPPSYVKGTDERGNIMHEVQPGDTVGDIALIYGYTWDDLPYMLSINNLADVRDLDVGTIFLVPPQAGTYTPTANPFPVTLVTAAPKPTEDGTAAVLAALATTTPTRAPDLPTATQPAGAATGTAPGIDEAPTAEPMAVPVIVAAPTRPPKPTAILANALPDTPAVVVTRSSTSPWIAIALGLQVVLIGAAAFEFMRRFRRGRRR